MYNVKAEFSYEGSITSKEFFAINKIIYETSSGRKEVAGEEILTHFFPSRIPLYLQGVGRNYLIHPSNLVTLEIETSC